MNSQGLVPLMLLKYSIAQQSGRNVPITCQVVFSCSFWPPNGRLLFIKSMCVCVCVLCVLPPSGGQHRPGLNASTHSSIPSLV